MKKQQKEEIEYDEYSVHLFSNDIANRYGVVAALILEGLRYYIEENKKNKSKYHLHEIHGQKYYWTYNSMSDFLEKYPYLTEKQIKLALRKLRNSTIILTGDYNNLRIDRTRWYTTFDDIKEPTGKDIGRLNVSMALNFRGDKNRVLLNSALIMTYIVRRLSQSAGDRSNGDNAPIFIENGDYREISYKAFLKKFPYISKPTIIEAIKDLEERRAIETTNRKSTINCYELGSFWKDKYGDLLNSETVSRVRSKEYIENDPLKDQNG